MIAEIREPAVAGMFYPADPSELARTVDAMIAAVKLDVGSSAEALAPKAIVVPHAGYIYSGPIAASAFARLRGHAERIQRVVLVGPAHRAPVRGLVWPEARALETPLGDLEVDVDAIARVPEVSASAYAHMAEHSLEVELPFLQRVCPAARIVPLAAGFASPESVGRVLETLWGGPETLVVISTDLSHYLPYGEAKRIDADTIARVMSFDVDGIDHDRACGATGLAGLLWVAKKKRLTPRLFDLRSSGDTAGDKRRVVGYCSLGFYEAPHSTPVPRSGAPS